MEVFSLLARLALDKTGYDRGLDQAEARGKRSASILSGAIGGATAAIGLSLLQLAANFTASIGRLTIGASASFEQTEVAFKTLLGSAEDAKAVLTDLNEFAANTPFQFPELAGATRQLAAFGIESSNLVPTLQRIGDVSAGISQPIGEIASIYGKARVQGRLFMEDINQLTGRGIPIIGELAEQFGVTESEVRKLVETGQVSFANLEQAFISLTSEGGIFFNMMQEQSQTLAGKWSTFTDNINLRLRLMSDQFIETFNIKGALDTAIKLLEEWGPRFQQNFEATLTGVKNIFTVAWDFINRGLDLLRQAFDNNFLGIRDIFDWFSKHVGRRLMLVVEFFQRVSSQADLMSLTIERIFRGLIDIFQGVAYVLKGFLLDPFIKVGQDIGKALTGILVTANSWVDKLGSLFGVDLKTVLGSAGSSIIDEFAYTAQTAFSGIIQQAEAYIATNESVQKGLELIATGSGKVAGAVIDADNASKAAMLNMSKNIDEVANSSNDLVTDANEAGEALENLGTTAGGTTSEGIDKATEKVTGLSDALINAIILTNEYNVLNSTAANLGIADSDAKSVYAAALARYEAHVKNMEAAEDEAEAENRLQLRLAYINDLKSKGFESAALARYEAYLESEKSAREEAKAEEEAAARVKQANWLKAQSYKLPGVARFEAYKRIEAAANAEAEAERRANMRIMQARWIAEQQNEQLIKQREALANQGASGFTKDKEAALKSAEALAEYTRKFLDLITAKEKFNAISKGEYETALRNQVEQIKNLSGSVDEGSEAWLVYQGILEEIIRLLGEIPGKIPNAIDMDFDPLTGKRTSTLPPVDKEAPKPSWMEQLKASALELGEKIFPGLGATIAAFQAGPLNGIITLFANLIGRSEAFEALIYQINKFLEPIIKAFGELLDALWPTIDVVLKLGFVALKPVIELLTKVVAPVLNATAKIIAGIWNVFAKAINWALGWIPGFTDLPTIDLSSTSGIPREPKDADPANPGTENEPRVDVNPFGDGSTGFPGVSGNIAEAVVGIPPDVMKGLLQPLLDAELMQVDLLGKLAGLNLDATADKFLLSGEMQIRGQNMLANTMDHVLEQLRSIENVMKGSKDFGDLRALSGAGL
jgi:tape measure domain-containing protein